MKLFPTLIAAATLMVSACSDKPDAMPMMPPPIAAQERLTIEQVRSDVALAKEAFERVHPGYTRYATKAEMDAAWQAIIDTAVAEDGMGLAEFYLASELALVGIRCDHTKAELPRSLREARSGKQLYLPARWTMIEGRAIVDVPGEGTGLAFGDEIVSMDGRPMAEVIAEVAPYVPVDGYTEWSRNGGIGQSREFMGGAVDHFGALLWDVPPIARLQIRSSDGSERALEMPRISFQAWSAMGAPSGANFKDAVQFERIGEDVAYIRIDTFVNYREPVQPDAIYDPIFKTIRDEGRDTLILDLRANGGGSSEPAYELLANVLDRPFEPLREMRAKTLDLDGIRPYLWTWDSRALNPNPLGFSQNDDGTYALRSFVTDELTTIRPARYAFEGEVIALTSNNNSSGSTNFIAWLTELERATTVGEQTGGSAEGPTAGLQFTLTLPNSGVRMRLPFFHVLNNISAFENGFGFSPDISATMTVAAFRQRRDPAVEAALVEVGMDASVAAQAPMSSSTVADISDFAGLVGDDWSGELEYLNYNSTERSTIPVRMFAREPDGRAMDYGFLYPGEEDQNSNDAMSVSTDGSRINGVPIIRRFRDEDGALVLVTQIRASDANEPADVRLTYTIAPRSFSVRKDVRFEGGEFFNRNEYRLTR